MSKDTQSSVGTSNPVSPKLFKHIVGIDFGDTNTRVAYVPDNNSARLVPNSEGDLYTPSVVAIEGSDVIVGKNAKKLLCLAPEKTFTGIKASLQTPHTFTDGTQAFTASSLAARILSKVLADTESYLSVPVEEAVLTCPTYFSLVQREALVDAAASSGLKVAKLVNEPVAIAAAYGLLIKSEQSVAAVYDLGGRTFDITVLRLEQGQAEVVCADGDHYLGGADWDEIILRYLAEEWQARSASQYDPLDDPEGLCHLLASAEAAKILLSSHSHADISVSFQGISHKISLTRQKFDELTDTILSRTIELTQQAVTEAKSAGLKTIDHFVLSGGMSRLPQVANRIRAEIGVEPRVFRPHEAVAKGAAILGSDLTLAQPAANNYDTDASLKTLSNAPIRHLSRETIFVSYRRSDWAEYVYPLTIKLREANLDYWVDQHLIEDGDDWFDEINSALRTCDRMILCLSPEALASRHVKLEYRYFFNHGKKIYPIMCRDTELPAELQTIQYYPYARLAEVVERLKNKS